MRSHADSHVTVGIETPARRRTLNFCSKTWNWVLMALAPTNICATQPHMPTASTRIQIWQSMSNASDINHRGAKYRGANLINQRSQRARYLQPQLGRSVLGRPDGDANGVNRCSGELHQRLALKEARLEREHDDGSDDRVVVSADHLQPPYNIDNNDNIDSIDNNDNNDNK